mmetsp:Transcript_41462/g.84769  ORF Transcript_41462/g.84769 Transcript_41462/m.84769 type:complete len:209 (-) Transcript_41462:1121-1747(-)
MRIPPGFSRLPKAHPTTKSWQRRWSQCRRPWTFLWRQKMRSWGWKRWRSSSRAREGRWCTTLDSTPPRSHRTCIRLTAARTRPRRSSGCDAPLDSRWLAPMGTLQPTGSTTTCTMCVRATRKVASPWTLSSTTPLASLPTSTYRPPCSSHSATPASYRSRAATRTKFSGGCGWRRCGWRRRDRLWTSTPLSTAKCLRHCSPTRSSVPR